MHVGVVEQEHVVFVDLVDLVPHEKFIVVAQAEIYFIIAVHVHQKMFAVIARFMQNFNIFGVGGHDFYVVHGISSRIRRFLQYSTEERACQ